MASGTPVAAGTIPFVLNASSACPFTRVVGTAYANANCSDVFGLAYNIPTTKTIGTTDVVITKTTNTDSGLATGVANACAITIASGSSSVVFSVGQSSTYTFSVPLKNVQVYGTGNESGEDNEGYTVTASLLGAPVRVQLVGYAGCFPNFISTQSGNSASIKNTTNPGAAGLIFNISSDSPYDSITISRASASGGGSTHSLLLCNAIAQPSSSNGTAVVTSYACGAGTGTLTASSLATGVTQTVMANVATIGTYNISTNAVNGVTFSSGVQNFAATGNQPVTLTASGTPINPGTFAYALNTGAGTGCSFNFTTVANPSSNGTGVVTSYTCTGASTGTMTVGSQITTPVTQVITANVTVAGSYNITAIANGVTFSSGLQTFAGTGAQPVTLTATGIPAAAGRHNFVLNTSDASKCNFDRSTGEVFVGNVCGTMISASSPSIVTIGSTNVTVTRTGTVFNGTPGTDCGLTPSGSQTALSGNQQVEYAFSIPVKNIQVFGWGNQVNENEGYTVTASLAGQNVPVQLSIVNTAGTCSANFTSTQVGTSGVVRITSASAGSSLVFNISTSGTYDKITVARAGIGSQYNTHGLMTCNATAVPSSSNGTAVISGYSLAGTQGSLEVNKPIAANTVITTLTANVLTAGSWEIATNPINGVTFYGKGEFAGTGNQPVVLYASGTPVAVGTHTFPLNTGVAYSFTRETVLNSTSNGTAMMTMTSCIANPTGRMFAGTEVSGVTQTLKVNAVTPGSYDITATNNGVIFAGSSNVLTGPNTIVLTARGVPSVGAESFPFTVNTSDGCTFSRLVDGEVSSGGTAIIAVESCNRESGTIASGLAVSDVTQTISVNVTRPGSYNIIATARGITFSQAGLFEHPGIQNVVLTGRGIATGLDPILFSLNVTPSCNFIRTVTVNPSSNGTAVFTNIECSNAPVGIFYAGMIPSGVKQSIHADMTRTGTYSITTDTQNGVTFAGSASPSGTPRNFNFELTASGLPLVSGVYTFTLNTEPKCTFKREFISPSTNGTATVTTYSS
ncbi:MAG: hypothetical protein EOP54_16610, partial [Sphingobacteriales bacterium]